MFMERYCKNCGGEITYPGWSGTMYVGKKFCRCKDTDQSSEASKVTYSEEQRLWAWCCEQAWLWSAGRLTKEQIKKLQNLPEGGFKFRHYLQEYKENKELVKKILKEGQINPPLSEDSR